MTHFADCARQLVTPLLKNDELARDTKIIRISAPEMARRAAPGQFFMLRIPHCNDPLIGRAFALYACNAQQGWIEVVYLVKGKLTTELAKLHPGTEIAIWGPLGNAFSTEPVQELLLVAGGIGQTPFLSLAREALGRQSFGIAGRRDGYAARVHFCYGVRGREYLAGIADFESLGVGLSITTDDGSWGRARRVTDALAEHLDQTSSISRRVVCCGPEPMMEAVANIAAAHHLPCEVSLETPMACGVGICFTCVAKIGNPQDWDYKRTCVEGPIFNASEIVW